MIGVPRRESRRTYGSRAVVTGAGSGIGRAIAFELAERGGRVVCADIDIAAAEHTAAQICAAHGEVAIRALCDVASFDAVFALAEFAASWFDEPVDLVVNNAGVGVGGRPIGDVPIEDWRWALGINLWGVVHGCHVFVPGLRELGRGGVINVASAASFAAAPNMGPYNTGKAAVLSLSETLAAELAGTGVAVSVLCPTFVKTNITKHGRIDEASARAADRAMARTGRSAAHIALATLDAHDRGRLHVLPQLDARVIWGAKRLAPAGATRAMGTLNRLATSRTRANT